MSVAGYEKVKTKVIEGKKKCIYKKYKGTKLYVKGFGKMRSVESYIKLCKKAAAKSAKSAKPMKAKKARSKTARKYGGFLQEFFSDMEKMGTVPGSTKKSDDKSPTSDVAKGDTASPAYPASPATPPPNPPATPATPPAEMSPKVGGSSCSRKGGNRGGNPPSMFDLSKMLSVTGGYRGGQSLDQFNNQTRDQFQSLDQFKDISQDGGRRRKRNKGAKSMLDKLMMAANFRKRSAKKGKKLHRKGGNALVTGTVAEFGKLTDSLMGGKKKKRNGGSSQFNY